MELFAIFSIIGVIILAVYVLKIYFKSSNQHVHKTANIPFSLRKYDLDTLEGIRSIPLSLAKIPHYSTEGIAYILQRKATEHKRNGNMDLAIECLRKSNALMFYEDPTYASRDYLRLVSYLKKAGRQQEAEYEYEKIKSMFPEITLTANERFANYNLQAINNHELVKMETHTPTCAECSIYQGRVYSVSGRDKRFPKLPDKIRKNGLVHPNCRHSFFPYLINEFTIQRELKNDIIESNRPFVDTRTPEEIAEYEIFERNTLVDDTDYKNYEQLIRLIPDAAPKSYSAYRRMKNANTANYKKLVSIAKTHGMDIDKYRKIKTLTSETQAPTNEFISIPQNNTYKTCEEISFESEMRIVEDCERLVVETKNLEVFISRYKLLYEKLRYFMSEYGHLPDRLEYNESLFNQRLIDCVDRIVADAEKLKTDKGRFNRIENLEAYLQDCYDKETDDVFKEALYYNLDRVKIIKCNMV